MKTNTIDMIGLKFERWTVIERVYRTTKGRQAYWLCRCECGVEREVGSASLRSGASRSCGCLQRDVQKMLQTKHGMSDSPAYGCWRSMIGRCYYKTSTGYIHYGGRGISVCDRWKSSFSRFLEDMGERPSDRHSIGRIDNEGNYEPGNCRWETHGEQCRNTRRNRIVEHEGVSMTITDWAERTGLSSVVIEYRISAGWGVKDALETPAERSKPYRFKDKDRKVITLTLGQETLTLTAWSRRTGIALATLLMRKNKGWSDERTLTQPVRPMSPRKNNQGVEV